jgi:hypothetical protein
MLNQTRRQMSDDCMKSFQVLLKKIALHIPILERQIRLKEHPYKIIRKYKREIHQFFKNTADSQRDFYKKQKINNLIISLTSFPERIELFEYTLFSLLNQTIRPERIILWLSKSEFEEKEKSVPKNLAKYYEFGFEIKFVNENYKSYKKLIYVLSEYKNCSIVTADDDIYYPPNWLELLYKYHKNFPDDIIAHRIHNISFKDGHIDIYKNWKGKNNDISFLNFPTTGGGVLYPPASLHPDAVNSEVFLKLCPHADDIWFYIMALLKKTKIRRINNGYQHVIDFDYIFNRKVKKIPRLWDMNRTNNDIQLKNTLDYYGIYDSFYQCFNDTN